MPDRNPRYLVTALVGALALTGVAISPATAQEDDDEELSFEQNIIRSLVGGGAARPDIDYRERSPLVIPPSRDLPPPDRGAAVQGNAAWPQDPDQRRRPGGPSGPGGADEAAKREARALGPGALRQGARGGAGRSEGPVVTPGDAQLARPLTPSELGETRGLFGLMTRTEGPAQFTREPTRRSLTQPPTGYQTPSQAQPYVPPKETNWFRLPNIFERTTPSNDR